MPHESLMIRNVRSLAESQAHCSRAPGGRAPHSKKVISAPGNRPMRIEKKLFETLEFLKFGVSGKFLPLFLPRALIGWGASSNDSRLAGQKGDSFAHGPKNNPHN